MQFRKLSVKNLEVGHIYVAFSGKNKLLSKNGDKGVFVKLLETNGVNIKVQMLGTDTSTAIAKLDTREDAWLYDPMGSEMQVVAKVADKQAWPGFTARMEREGWNGKAFTFKDDEMYLVEDDDNPHKGALLMRHEGDTIDLEEDAPYVNTFLMSDIYPVEPPEWRVPSAQRMGIGAIELPLPPKPVAEQHNAIINALAPHVKALRENHDDSNVSFAKYGKDFKEIRTYPNQACHRTMTCDEAEEVHYILTIGRNDLAVGSHGGWNKGHASEEAEILWITYLVGYSPYKDAFITKDIEFIREHGYILDASQPNRVVVGACYATRQVWEKSPRLEAFLKLYEAGVPLHLAFVFGSQCSEYKDGKMKFAQDGNNHSHLYNGKLSDKCIENFFNMKPQFPGKPYIESCRTQDQQNVDSMWSSKFGETCSVYNKLKEIKGGGSWGGAVAIDQAIDKAADIIDDWAQKVGL